jgi:hypothetical protein
VLRKKALNLPRIASTSDDEAAAVVGRSPFATVETPVENKANKFIISDDVTGGAGFVSSVAV